jgi:hypothetical protein
VGARRGRGRSSHSTNSSRKEVFFLYNAVCCKKNTEETSEKNSSNVRDLILYTANNRKIYFGLSTECTNKSKKLLLSVTNLGWEGSALRQGCRSGIGSGSRKGLYSFEFLDPDPYSEYGSGFRYSITITLLI